MDERAPLSPNTAGPPPEEPLEAPEGEEIRVIEGVAYRVTKYPMDEQEIQAVRNYERNYGSKSALNLHETSPNIESPPNSTGRQKRSKAPSE